MTNQYPNQCFRHSAVYLCITRPWNELKRWNCNLFNFHIVLKIISYTCVEWMYAAFDWYFATWCMKNFGGSHHKMNYLWFRTTVLFERNTFLCCFINSKSELVDVLGTLWLVIWDVRFVSGNACGRTNIIITDKQIAFQEISNNIWYFVGFSDWRINLQIKRAVYRPLVHGPLTRYVKLWVCMRRECREHFPRHRW